MKDFPNSSTDLQSPPQPFHYGWLIMVAGTVCIFGCLGLGRFSLGMLLPSMGKGLYLSYAEMGFISTANFVGYLGAVLISSRVMRAVGGRYCITAALVIVGISMLMIGKAETKLAVTVLYILTGMGSALANVPIMALISIWFTGSHRGKAAGFVVIGSGFAILLCGWLIPQINTLGADGWRLNWMVLGSIVVGCAIFCFLILRNNPADMGLLPVGDQLAENKQKTSSPSPEVSLTSRIVLHCGVIYFLFGFTYVIYVTFVVTFLVEDRGYAESVAGIFWSCIGLLSLLSGPIPGAFSDKFGRKAALIAVFGIQAMAYLLVALPLPDLFLFISVACYGLVAWSVPSIISALVADFSGQLRVAAIFGFVTFIFGLGQISGPYLGGLLAEKTGSFSWSFFIAFCLALAALLFSILLPSKNSKILRH